MFRQVQSVPGVRIRSALLLALAAAIFGQSGALRVGSHEVPASQVLPLPAADSGGRVSVDAGNTFELTLPGVAASEMSKVRPTLRGPGGTVALDRAAAKNGLAIYLRPKVALKPGTAYELQIGRDGYPTSALHLLVNGRPDGGGPNGVLTEDGGRWIPDLSKQRDDWFTHLPDHSLPEGRLLKAPIGATALRGQVRLIGDQPLANVTLSVGAESTTTDSQGRFLLSKLPTGGQVLTIDATTANGTDTRYGVYQAHVDLTAGQTSTLPYTVWMSRLATEHGVKVTSPTLADTVIRSPDIPGLELRIPKGTVIKDRDGKTVSEISITAVPIDRAPFPLPRLEIPTYFTIQPGGAYLVGVDGKSPRGAQLVYPNYARSRAGEIGVFWNYDPRQRGWYKYGRGRVTADGRQVVPNAGVEIYSFTGAMFNSRQPTPDGPPIGPNNDPQPPPQDPDDGSPTPPIHPCPCGSPGANPIDLATGAVIRESTDMVVQDVIPIALSRSFTQDDSNNRAFGKGWSMGYDSFLYSKTYIDPIYYKEVDFVLPGGTRIHYVRSVPGSTFSDAVLTHYGSQGRFYKSTVAWDSGFGGWQVTFKDGSRMRMPETSMVTEIYDRNNNKILITRNGNYATRITSPSGRYIDLTLDSSNRISAATDQTGRSVQYVYDADGYLTTVTYPDNTTMAYTYLSFPDYPHKMLSVVKDRRGVLKSTTEFARYITTFQTQFAYTGGSALGSTGGGTLSRTAVTSTPSSATFTGTTGRTSGSDNTLPASYQCLVYKPSRQTYPDGGATTFEWTLDNYCRIIKSGMTDPMGYKTVREFNIDGQLVKETQAVGTPQERVTTNLQRTAENPRFSSSGGKPPVTVLPNDPTNDPGSNFVKQVTDTAGRTSTFQYDAAGNTIQTISPAGTSSATYNTFGFPLTVTNVLNQTTTLTYDVKGNVTSVKDALGKTTTMTYTLLGQIAIVTDPLGRTVTYAYTGPDLISMTDALGRTLRFNRDSLGRMTSTTDPLGRVSRVRYDLLDRVVSTTDPAGKVTSMQRDGEGLLLQLTDPTNKVFKWAYDWAGRVTTQTDPLNQVESYAYNLNSNPSTITDRKNQVTTYSYDALDRQISATDPVATQTYTYDTLDRLTGITEGSNTLAYTYNTLDQLISETTPQGAVLYTYDALGKRTSMTIGSAVTGYTYDAGNRITAMTRGPQTVGFGYDLADRTTSVTLPNGTVMGYGYDNGDQLTGINYVKGATILGNLTYSYDTAGQRTGMGGSFARTILPTAVPNATYDANNRQTTWGAKTLTYDINGNLTGDGTYTYLWNARDQLTQVKQGSTVVSSYSYDAVGRRTAKTLGAATTSYLYDGVKAVKEVTGSNTADLLSLGVDQVFSRTETGGTQSLLTDGLGSTLALGDSAGNLGTTYTYGAYGQTQSVGAASTNSNQYTGREQDAAGLYYYRARYYSTDLSRFISQDPIGLSGGVNWYGYANGNPVEFIDPLGESYAEAYVGFVDGLTQDGFLGSRNLRTMLGLNDPSIYCSPDYQAGFGNGDFGTNFLGVLGGVRPGRLGGPVTRGQIEGISRTLASRGWTVTGGGKLREEYLPPLGGGRKGASYPDITAVKDGKTLRINTVDTYRNGTMTNREATNADRIRLQTPGDHLITIPKIQIK